MQGIEVRALTWKAKGRKKEILKQVSLQFEPGHIYGIIGPNGSGKSSFLRHVMGFLPVQEGSVLLEEKEIGKYRRRELAQKIAFVPQQTRLDTDFSAYDIVMTGRNPYQARFGRVTKKDMELVTKALVFTRCEKIAEQPFMSLSGGEAQRVIVARAIAQDTEWMVLDEPVSSLDIRSEMELMEQLKRLNREKNTSILIVLHDVNLAAAYCDRLVMLRDGEVLYAGETKEGMTCGRLEELYGIGFRCVETDGRRLFYAKL